MSQPLTLCYVADATNVHVRRWLTYFAGRGHRVYCLSDKGGNIDGVNVIMLPNRDTLAIKPGKNISKTAVLRARTRLIRSTLKNIKPDILHAIFLYQRGWSAALSGFHPLVTTLLGSDIYLPERHYRHSLQLWRDQYLNKLSLEQSDLITAVSEDLHQRAMQMNREMCPVTLIPIGIDPDLFHPHEPSEHLRKELDISADNFVIFSPRQITPHYNQGTILECIPQVLAEIPKAIFVMKDTFCNTPERQEYVQTLKDKADNLGVSHAVRWVDEVPLEELPLYYGISDVVVSIPTTDGMPVTFFEAMACQKPLIAGDLPSYDDVIIHGQTGLRVPIGNSQVLARTIIKLRKTPALTQRLIEESQVILHQYGIFYEQMMRMEYYYQGLLNPSSAQYQDCHKVNGHFFRRNWSHMVLQAMARLT